MKKKARLLAVLLTAVVLLTGCRFGDNVVITTTSMTDNEVFIIGNEKCSVALMKMMLANQMNLQKNSYGIDLMENEDLRVHKRFEQYVKNLALDEMSTVYTMSLLADSYIGSGASDIELTEAQLEQVSWAAEEYESSITDEEKKITGVSREDIENYYTRYVKAIKVKQHIIKDVDTEVSDNEARVVDAEQIYTTHQANLSKIKQELASGSSFITVAANYNEADNISVAVQRGDYAEEVEQVIYDMENDEVSDAIQTGDGWYFIHCVNKNNDSLTTDHKKDIVIERQENAFNQIYSPFVKNLSSQLNEKIWEEINLEELAEISDTNFFKIFDKYFGNLDK